QFPRDGGELAYFGDDFCRHAQWFLRLSRLRSLWLRCQDLGVDKVFIVGGPGVEVPHEIEQFVFVFGCQETSHFLPRERLCWLWHTLSPSHYAVSLPIIPH